jgi:hypothetical protein
MLRVIFLLSILIFSTCDGLAQGLNTWEVYPSFSTVNSISSDSETIYASTLGGVFLVESNNVEIFTTMDGLYRSDPTSIIYDEENERIFTGYIDGTIDVIEVEDGLFTRLDDIRRVNRFSSKGINGFNIYNGNLYTATQFGIVVYDLQNLTVQNSYLKLGLFDIGIEVNDIIVEADTVYAATIQGVATGELSDNLFESSNWIVYNSSDGLASNRVDQVAYYNGEVYALSEQTVFVHENGTWVKHVQFPEGEVVKIHSNLNGQNIGASTLSSVILIDADGNSTTYSPNIESSISELYLRGEEILLGTTNEGLKVYDIQNNSTSTYLPSGPYLNFINDTITDGTKVIATSTNEFPSADPLNPIRGYYIFSDGEWKNYNRNTRNELASIQTVYIAGQSDTDYYFGSWGHGVIKQNKDADEINVYNASNSNLTGVFANPNYVVVSGIGADRNENIWAISYNSEFPLNVKLRDSDEWLTFRGAVGSENYYNLFIDAFDQKWISLVTESNSGLGLLIVDTGDAVDPNDDRSVKLTSLQGNGNLPDEKVKSFIQDKRDEVWIGTERGIARFIFPELIIEGGNNERQAQWLINADTTAASRFLLRDINVSAMAVNDANQKWIGSENQGLWLLNEDGSRIEKRFTSENSNLISNNINSIAINNETGEVFISTALGLTSYQDIPKAPVAEIEKLKVFPNPFEYARHNQIIIEGLSQATKIKILGVDGFVVNELQAQGGRVSWDGYDHNGNELGSGVYFVIAYEESGRERGTGKVVIVK